MIVDIRFSDPDPVNCYEKLAYMKEMRHTDPNITLTKEKIVRSSFIMNSALSVREIMKKLSDEDKVIITNFGKVYKLEKPSDYDYKEFL